VNNLAVGGAGYETFLDWIATCVNQGTDWLVVVNPDGQFSLFYAYCCFYQRGGLVCHHVLESRVSNYYRVYQMNWNTQDVTSPKLLSKLGTKRPKIQI